jgi:hypothetical protein
MPREDFLSYRGSVTEDVLTTSATLAYLRSLGFGENYLTQSRDAVRAWAGKAFTFEPERANYCDFCFAALTGVEYDALADGRERCVRCSKSALRSEEDFVETVTEVQKRLQLAFGVRVRMPDRISMVNAKEIARQTGETFAATPGVDPRVLGFATKSGNGHYSLSIENGAPKLAAIVTIAHELVHVWQYTNWNENQIVQRYGRERSLAIYEGMATWAQVQFLYFIKEFDFGERQDAYARSRTDEYGEGYRAFGERYPIDRAGNTYGDSPFRRPLPL